MIEEMLSNIAMVIHAKTNKAGILHINDNDYVCLHVIYDSNGNIIDFIVNEKL